MDIYFSLLLLFVFDIKNYSKELLQNFLNLKKKKNQQEIKNLQFLSLSYPCHIKPGNP